MDKRKKALFEARARVIKALAHPSRLWMVSELESGERCVCELAEMLEVDMSTASKHLTVLKGAGIVGDERRGSKVFYALKVPCILGFLDCVEAVLKSEADELLSLRSARA
jgi:ArsR family transcriptional regulator